jgi:hypothetical protein
MRRCRYGPQTVTAGTANFSNNIHAAVQSDNMAKEIKPMLFVVGAQLR